MAKIVQAFNTYGPRLVLNPTAQLDRVAGWMAMRTGLNKSEITMVLQELSDAVLYYNRQGMPVKVPGIGTFSPSINRAGEIKIHVRTDGALKRGIAAPESYTGTIENRERAGLDDAGYKALWDADHPDDPLEV